MRFFPYIQHKYNIEITITEDMFYSASVLANIIINTYFSDSNCLLILTQEKLNDFYYSGNFSHVLVNVHGTNIPRNLIFRSYGCQGIVVIHANPLAIFENLENQIRLEKIERFNNRRYLFLPTENQVDDVLKIFQSESMQYVADILAVKLNSSSQLKLSIFDNYEESIFDLYTHKFVGPVGGNEIIWLDRWFGGNQSFLREANLYPNRLKDQRGKPFKIICFTYKPYSIVDPPDGTDMLVAVEYGKRHNMTLEFVVDEENEWGDVYANWTGRGVLGNLVQDKGDVGIGALYSWKESFDFFDFSKPVMRTGVTCIAPAPRLASGLSTPFAPFSLKLWIITAIAYILASASMFIILSISDAENNQNNPKVQNVEMSFELSGRIFLLQSFQKVPNLEQSRITFGLALILSLLLNTMYSSGLSSTMTIPKYYGTIHDVNDLVASGMNWGATSTAWISSIESDSREVIKKVVRAFQIINEESLTQLNDRNFAYAVERLQAGNLAIGSYVTLEGAQRRRLLDSDIYMEFCVLMTRKSSILLPSLNDLVFAVTESGLVYHWEYQAVVKYMDINTQKAIKESIKTTKHGGTLVKLGLNHVIGAFTIWGAGLLLSIIAFIIELFTARRIKIALTQP